MPTDAASERRALALFEAMLALPEGERAAWLDVQCSEDDQLRARLYAILAADRVEGLRTGGAAIDAADEALPEAIGPYAITSVIGRGGMGTVYRGERMAGDFARTVAIKRIKPGLLSDKLVGRFERERQTLARLEHVHIARLYDGGTTPDGAPFLVMEYVDGEPIVQWAAANEASRETRLKLFIDTCDAVAHAHRNLIVHRDITPANVLVTHAGIVKLIDFGISRDLDDADALPVRTSNSLASLTLTPGYAAPERMAGGAATTLADVFSLGKLLGALVSTRDAELDSIVKAATAEKPEARYSTVDGLAADVSNYRTARPVTAMGRQRGYLWRKFYVRNRAPVLAGVAALALLLLAFGGTIWALDRAQVARAETERRFAQTRGIAKTVLFDVYDDVSKVSGATRARVTLAKTGLAYLDALAADADAPRDVLIETGRGYLRLAQVTGDGQSAQLGKFEDANSLLAKATAILEPLHKAAPADPVAASAYAALLVELAGTNIYNNSKPALARSQAREAQRLLAPLQPFDAPTARQFALAMQAEGDSHIWESRFEEARRIHERAERFITSLPPKLARTADILQVQRSNLRYLGEALHNLKMVEAARAALDRNVVVARELVALDSAHPTYARNLSLALRYAAVVHRTNKRNAEARAAITESVQIARRLLERDPRDAGAANLFVLTAEVLAQVLGDARDYQQSYDLGAQIYAVHKKAVALGGNTPGAIRNLATSTATRGGNHYNGGDFPNACRWWRNALDLFLGLQERGALTEFDRKTGMIPLQRFIGLGCDGGRPRKLDGGAEP